MKFDIKDFTFSELSVRIQESGLERYRADQIFNSVHGKLVKDIISIKGIPVRQRTILDSGYRISGLNCISTGKSEKDSTLKFLFESDTEGKAAVKFESVLISDSNRNTACISTQAGCNVGCEFCATGKMKLKRNLTAGEIISQIYSIYEITGIKPTNIVYMGMGEPFLNYDNLLNSLIILTDKKGFGIPSGRITVSTVGFTGRIKKFADDLSHNPQIRKVKLALSLHSTDNGLREMLIPSGKSNKLSDIYEELVYFYKITRNKVTYEYIYFEGLNDSDNDIKRLSRLSKMIPSNINIIPFHPVDFALIEPLEKLNLNRHKYAESGKEKSLLISENLTQFMSKLRNQKVTVNLRSSSGIDINAACGQLAVRNIKQS
ncbi:MAG: 23S rRNA (adenine(2503)-C(2))-methyltransferase RlmN [Ignavibacteria bacterium]|nr:23S rRNA (adenine(2503)-C(2))-methyltransferase RlmN [Ignavibacteria bacterium]